MFSLWTLIEASLLCLNAVCILHEERFMAKGNIEIKICYLLLIHFLLIVGWGTSAHVQGFGESASTKAQLLNLIRSIRTVAKSNLKFTSQLEIIYFYDLI